VRSRRVERDRQRVATASDKQRLCTAKLLWKEMIGRVVYLARQPRSALLISSSNDHVQTRIHPWFARNPIKFVDGLKRRRTSNKVTNEEIRVLREKRMNDDARKAEEQRQKTLAKAKATAEAQSADEEVLFARVLSCMTDCGFGSLHRYLHHLMTTKAQHASSQASKHSLMKVRAY